MPVLAVCNAKTANLGFLQERLAFHELGPVTTVCRTDPAPWPDPGGFDLVVAVGSRWSVNDDAHAAALRHEGDLYRKALAGAVPVLAICYGAHALALALGAPSHPAPQPEAGFVVVDTADPALVPSGPWLTWHSDLLAVPVGATLVARTPVAPQAWSLGRALALQFHPELTPAELESWIDRDADWMQEHHIDTEALLTDARSHQESLRERAHALFDAYWTRIARSPDR